ncbi:MAG: electron transport complex subunit RsxA [Candidatus Omnitrophica bacterium CG1_02_44_16]|nr:MAG: electron transport complex subunit RsxA [Candidatus Omnitrophica bacterium CG1_02_44_16]PIY82444.1 MAG: electron transport complex subunit RsxA [Candidatus Omnitrophica bacterium CG_4_10_14_0_8_um_filter_44_12]PIZ84694.1 MAG: electron transport complex subunit RsxA [Candidatus Omnitrophica bacterium CG_4_10_14_0_2_um_filter_44_9]
MDKVLAILIANIITNNYILFKFMGLCPFLGVSKQTKPAISMGLAVIFVLLISGIMTWIIYAYVILPFHIEYMRTVVFILIIASSVQFIEMMILKVSPVLYKALGIYLPLITTNCIVLGVTVINTEDFFAAGKPIAWSFAYSVLQVFAAGLGFMLVLLLMSGIRERLALTDTPESLDGLPIAFIVASIMGLAFMGLLGIK